MIEILPYQTNWPQNFAIEAQHIKNALGKNCISIHHIGSTSVPGLAAKPVIDILPIVADITLVDGAPTLAMQEIEYTALGECGMLFRRLFQKGKALRTHNVHIFEEGNSEIERHLKFRDWMREHQEDRLAYAKLNKI